jgi:hypothetical protein
MHIRLIYTWRISHSMADILVLIAYLDLDLWT